MPIPASFLALVNHPAPGLRFTNPEISDGITIAAPHRFGPPSDPADLDRLRKLSAACPALQADLLDFYSRWSWADLCCFYDEANQHVSAFLGIPTIQQMLDATQELLKDEYGCYLEGNRDMYVPGRFQVVVMVPSEGTLLSAFFEGRLDDIDLDLANRIFYLALDPILGEADVVAEGFGDLLHRFATDPAGFLNFIGATHSFSVGDQFLGHTPAQYLPDCGLTFDHPFDT